MLAISTLVGHLALTITTAAPGSEAASYHARFASIDAARASLVAEYAEHLQGIFPADLKGFELGRVSSFPGRIDVDTVAKYSTGSAKISLTFRHPIVDVARVAARANEWIERNRSPEHTAAIFDLYRRHLRPGEVPGIADVQSFTVVLRNEGHWALKPEADVLLGDGAGLFVRTEGGVTSVTLCSFVDGLPLAQFRDLSVSDPAQFASLHSELARLDTAHGRIEESYGAEAERLFPSELAGFRLTNLSKQNGSIDSLAYNVSYSSHDTGIRVDVRIPTVDVESAVRAQELMIRESRRPDRLASFREYHDIRGFVVGVRSDNIFAQKPQAQVHLGSGVDIVFHAMRNMDRAIFMGFIEAFPLESFHALPLEP